MYVSLSNKDITENVSLLMHIPYSEIPRKEEIELNNVENTALFPNKIIKMLNKRISNKTTSSSSNEPISTAKQLCFHSEDILSEIASYLLSEKFSLINKAFYQANRNLSIKNKELSILIGNENLLQYINIDEIFKIKMQLEKTLYWINRQKFIDLKIVESRLGLINYTKTVLQTISISAIPSRREACAIPLVILAIMSFFVGLVTLGSLGTVLYEASLISRAGNAHNFTETIWYQGHTFEVTHNIDDLRNELPLALKFLLFSTIGFLIFSLLTCGVNRKSNQMDAKYDRKSQSYLEVMKKCVRVIKFRSHAELDSPNIENSENIRSWILDTYRDHPETLFHQANDIHSDINTFN